MKCNYYDKILEFEEHSASVQEKDEILKHISSCENCKELYNMLYLSSVYSSYEYEARSDFYKQVIASVDSKKYKSKSFMLPVLIFFEKLKPAFKPLITGMSVTALLFLIIIYRGQLYEFLRLDAYPSKNPYNVNEISFLRTDGENLVMNNGNNILLNGVNLTNNVWGNWVSGVSEKLEAEGKSPLVKPVVQDSWVLADVDFKRIEDMGCNSVRYDFNYQLFDKSNPNQISNILKLKSDIQHFYSLNIYTVLCMSIVPGLDTINDTSENTKPPLYRMKSVFESDEYFNQWKEIWEYVVEQLKDTPGLAGYEIMCEPRLPSEKDGGLKLFQKKLNNLCSAIRKVDRNRIIFVPEYQSREANPGEKYYHEDNTIIDSGEQGIIWETGFVKVDDSNVAYVFQFFDPYEYTFYGKGDYTIEDLQSLVEKRAMWARTIGKASLVARYGISRINPSQQRVSWLQTVHSIFSKFNISSSYHEYKNLVGTYNPSNDGFFAIYGQYNNWKNEISLTGNSYSFLDKDMEYTAETTKFKDVLDRFFFKDGKIESVSIMDNEDILNTLKDYWKN